MAEARSDGGDEREAELLRINAELAAEIRSLTAARVSAPRSTAGPAARRVSRLLAERDSLAAELERSRAEADDLRRHGETLGRQVGEQARQIEALSVEVNRLRGGAAGALRRIRARLLRR
jgi:hypothetical protein